MSAPQDPTSSDLSGASPSRPRRRALFRRLALLAGCGLLTVAGIAWLVHLAGPRFGGSAAQGPGDHAPMPVCASADGTVLHADVDGDGHVDEVRDPEREGTVTIVDDRGDSPWSANLDHALGWWDRWRSTRSDLETRGTFGDFDGDGYVDLVLFHSEPHLGDDPVENMPVHEVRYGPLARDLTSERVAPVRISWKGFVYGVRATDQDGDGRAELQVFQTAGDGVVELYTGRQGDDGVIVSEEIHEYYDLPSWKDTELGWRDFGLCADD